MDAGTLSIPRLLQRVVRSLSLASTPLRFARNTVTVTIHFDVPDVDATIARAAAAGASVVMPAADMFWGDRYGVVEDPYGHRWSVATHQVDLTAAEIEAAAQRAMGG